MHTIGGRLFSYNNPKSVQKTRISTGQNYGVELWRANYDGAMNYAYMTSFQSAWDDLDHLHFRDHNFVYPTSNGVISTIAWEGFREGWMTLDMYLRCF